MKTLLAALVLLSLPMGAMAQAVVPNFTRGTVDSNTTTKTTVTESIRQVDYTTGSSYNVTGTNIFIPDKPQEGAAYRILTQGAPFQFSETILRPGIAKETWVERTTTQESFTQSLSVFTQ